MRSPLRIPHLALLLGTFGMASAQAQITTEYLKVHHTLFSEHPFVNGGGSNASAESQLYWYIPPAVQGGSVGAGTYHTEPIGGGAQVSVTNVQNIRSQAVGALTNVGKLTFSNSHLSSPSTGIYLNLGTNVLKAPSPEYVVSDTFISIIDFGAALTARAGFNVVVELWNGTSTVTASALSDLSFTIVSSPSNTGGTANSFNHVEGNTFRFSENRTGGSGSTLTIRSGLSGYVVKSVTASSFTLDFNPGGSLGDWVDIQAGRELVPRPIPEPSALALFIAAGLPAVFRRRR